MSHSLYHMVPSRMLGTRLRPLSSFADRDPAFYDHRDDLGTADPIRPEQVEWFDARSYEELQQIPAPMMAWCRKIAATGRAFAWFHGMPHVMVRGELDVGAASIVRWSEPPQD